MVGERGVCPCRRSLSESDLFYGYHIGGAKPEACDEAHMPITAAEKRVELDAKRLRAEYAVRHSRVAEAEARAAQRSAEDVLRRLGNEERRLVVGGRNG